MRLIFFIFLLFSHFLYGQSTLSGMVTDVDNEPLAFVSILVESDHPSIAFTNIEGRFTISSPSPVRSLTFRYVGFETQVIRTTQLKKELKVVLRPSDLSLSTVDIIAGENPANIIIRKATANRHRNNPEWNNSYTCNTYNKIVFEALPNRKKFEQKKQSDKLTKSFEKVEKDMANRYVFMMESVTERSFLAPNLTQERVLHNRISGFRDAGMVALANAVQPFSFYGDYLVILDKKFINPISPGSTKFYFFSLKDTLYDGRDTVWVIAFKPAKGKVFMGLKGVLHIHSRYFAVQHVLAGPAFGNENFDMNMEQGYSFIPDSTRRDSGQWFPQQLNFEITMARYPSPEVGVKMTGHSFVSEARPGISLKQKDFNPEQPVFMVDNAATRDSTVWNKWRADVPFSMRENNTYLWLDSIGNKQKFDQLAKVVGALYTLVWPLNEHLGIQINQLAQLNEYEGIRIGFGLTNAQHRPLGLSRRWEWGAGAGYGIQDKQIKYNTYLLWRIHRGHQTQLRFSADYDLAEPGAPYELSSGGWVDRSFYAQRTDLGQLYTAQLSSRLGKILSASVTVRDQQLRPASYEYAWQENENSSITTRFHFREATAFARLAYRERPRTFLGNTSTVQRFPVLEMAFTQGFDQYRYQRWLGALYQSVFIPRLGYLQWRIEAGKSTGAAPLARLFTLNQSGGGFSVFAVGQTFQSLPDTLFLHSRFANIFLRQEIGPVLWQRQHSAPFLSVLHNAAWGDLQHPEQHSLLGFASMNRPFQESGIRLDNLVRINYVNFGWIGAGAVVFYRWGAFSSPDWRQNIALRLSLKFSL